MSPLLFNFSELFDFVVQQYATHVLAGTTCDHSILFMIHSARKCLI